MQLTDFQSATFLRQQMRHTMAFYEGRNLDSSGGFFQYFEADGSVYDHSTRHLVSSARFVVTHAMAFRHFGRAEDQAQVRHGLRFLHQAHAQVQGGYAWKIEWRQGHAWVLDGTNQCYGLAFVLLAHAHAAMAGVPEAAQGLKATFDLMEHHLWEPRHGLYADEASADWQLSNYRGQNANMHVCEAMLAAFEATGETPYLDRANTLAQALTRRQAALAGNLVWEHYHADWSVDWDYNRNDKTNKFRPWGYQTGHLTEWAKLLLQLERQAPAAWLISQAGHFFNTAIERGWDPVHGGLVYGFDTEGQVCDNNKYFWVQAESAVAAAWLAERTGDSGYWVWYERLWSYMLQHFWDPQHGTWHNLLSNDNRLRGDQKSSSGKTDYHIMGACCDMLRAMNISHVGP